jgi:hypothetical protein
MPATIRLEPISTVPWNGPAEELRADDVGSADDRQQDKRDAGETCSGDRDELHGGIRSIESLRCVTY